MTINFDKAATTPVSSAALDAFLHAPQGNPSSHHSEGVKARKALEEARAKIAACVGAYPNEVYFTSGSTEACNWALRSMESADALKSVIVSPFEHSAVTGAKPEAKCAGAHMAHILANNVTGTVYNINRMRAACSGLFFTDATAAVGHIPVNFRDLGVDYMAFGGHKFGAPKGIGALIVRHGAPLVPLIRGGGQESGMRGGTESVPLACSMAAALEQAVVWSAVETPYVRTLCGVITRDIPKVCGKRAFVHFPHSYGCGTLPGIVTVVFPGIAAQSMVLRLSEVGILASAGAACSSGSLEPSPSLVLEGETPESALCAVRFSLDQGNTLAEVDRFLKLLPSVLC